MRNRYAVVAAFAVATLGPTARPAIAQDVPPTVPREFRGVSLAIVANSDWPSRPGLTAWEQQAELLATLDRALTLDLNAAILQVRPAADALYESPYVAPPHAPRLTQVLVRAVDRFGTESSIARPAAPREP